MEVTLDLPIPKPGKKVDDIAGWRGITLSSCINKIFETLIKNRLDWDMEKQQSLNKYQFGFRKSRGTLYNLTAIYSIINIGMSKREKVIGAFLDLKTAYDRIFVPKIIQDLNTIGINEDICSVIIKLLQDRKVRIREPSSWEVVGPGTVNRGLPQAHHSALSCSM